MYTRELIEIEITDLKRANEHYKDKNWLDGSRSLSEIDDDETRKLITEHIFPAPPHTILFDVDINLYQVIGFAAVRDETPDGHFQGRRFIFPVIHGVYCGNEIMSKSYFINEEGYGRLLFTEFIPDARARVLHAVRRENELYAGEKYEAFLLKLAALGVKVCELDPFSIDYK